MFMRPESPLLTLDGELGAQARDVQLHAAATLGVIASAQTGHALLAPLVHVHVTCWLVHVPAGPESSRAPHVRTEANGGRRFVTCVTCSPPTRSTFSEHTQTHAHAHSKSRPRRPNQTNHMCSRRTVDAPPSNTTQPETRPAIDATGNSELVSTCFV